MSVSAWRARGLALIAGAAVAGCGGDDDVVSRRGGLCGMPSLAGSVLPAVSSPVDGCGIEAPVRVEAVGGVALSPSAVLDCSAAEALATWVKTGLKPAVGRRGGGVSSIRVAADYACRTRNSRAGAKISEHGRGRAIDISALLLKDGTRIDVEQGWGERRDGALLRRLHGAACGPFGTVLGPDSDVYHRDHFHFDSASYSMGSYCR
ncbi:extensin-like domain-containing protein [Profundibacterium mesophilum]|uniref:Extensin-like C-terminal domain-containing protein n=1 Tax=Profundibacterium mesophilum KAUST100406-0324 TaxID=1037889 RepID=A0A921NYV7_9RHOB|nr:extensin family protein [Profundibacterium mesophilum]KAF0677214.1 uncharacterized protein PMES_00531 [Profundibacterium mesophilum KAUST100406-0324]